MDLDALKTVLTVSQRGSFAAAARQLDMDPSSVSRAVAGVEDDLGIRLFHRSTRRLSLTEEGRIYVLRLAPLVEGLDEAAEQAKAQSVEPEGVLRITASNAYGYERLVPLIKVFQDTHPKLVLDLILTDDPVDLIAEGIDVAIRLAPSVSGDLICARLHGTRYMVCSAPGQESVTTPEDLRSMPCLRQNLPEFRDAWRFRQAGDELTVPVTGPVLLSSPLALRHAARQGLGPALLPDWLVANDLRRGRLMNLFPDWQVTATTFDTAAWLLYPSRRHLPARTRAAITVLRQALGRGGFPAPH
ncbi:LysR family transcriptional regulator [Shimia ponticola]|uniref:LysR family transcriptional regulator n=1 Tax=Shimia ponticola TaxID=2582893 RepID=UPI0011BDAC60|nr:LysR family transcriptional regulator [Shimia ponticola]